MAVNDDHAHEIEHWYAEWRYTTLYELSDDYLYQFDAPRRLFPWADDEALALLSERLLRELWEDGWARFARKMEGGLQGLDPCEIEAVIRGRAWRASPVSGDGIAVIVRATAKTEAWKERQQRGVVVEGDPGRPRPERDLPNPR